MILRQAYKYRLQPTANQHKLFSQYAGCCRLVWNHMLNLQKAIKDKGLEPLSYNTMAGNLPVWKQSDELSFLKDCPSQALQQTLMNLDRAIKDANNPRDEKEFPVFKKRGKKDSFRYPQGFRVEEHNKRVFLPKVGWVSYRRCQKLEGRPKNVTIIKENDQWYAAIQTELDVKEPVNLNTSIVGLDLGVKRFYTDSKGHYIEPIHQLDELDKRIAYHQRRADRKQKGSKNQKKTYRFIGRLHAKKANIRKDTLHKLTTTLSKNHAAVVIENLQVKRMAKRKGKYKANLNRCILNQGFGEFKRQLSYKLERLGGLLVLVNPMNTSRRCPKCGYVDKDNRKTQSEFKCRECSYEEHADLVGALNVLRAGHAQLACGPWVGGSFPTTAGRKQEPALTLAFS